MDVVPSKVLVLILLGVLKTGVGLLPLLLTKYLTRRRKQKCLNTFIGLVLCFGGGILLATVFMHILKEVRESLEEAMEKDDFFKDKDLDYPFAELLICMGFLLIFLIESVVHKFFGHHNHGVPPSQESTPTTGIENKGFEDENNQNKHSAVPTSIKVTSETAQSAKSSPFGNKKSDCNVYNVNSATLTSYTSFDAESLPIEIPKPTLRRVSESTSSLVREKSFIATIRGFLIVLALSIHSLFEGMAIGLEESGSGVWQIFAAVIIHSMAIVFCIGTEMITSGLKKKTIVLYMFILGINSPLGVLIGLIVTLHVQNASGSHLLAVGILQGLAGGTLLYITFFEVLNREKLIKYKMTGLLGAIAIVIGFTIMAVMEGTTSHSHSHGGGGHEDEHAGHAHGHAGHAHGLAGHGEGHGNAHTSIEAWKEKIFNGSNPYDHLDDHGHFHDHSHDHDHHDDHVHGEEGHDHDHDREAHVDSHEDEHDHIHEHFDGEITHHDESEHDHDAHDHGHENHVHGSEEDHPAHGHAEEDHDHDHSPSESDYGHDMHVHKALNEPKNNSDVIQIEGVDHNEEHHPQSDVDNEEYDHFAHYDDHDHDAHDHDHDLDLHNHDHDTHENDTNDHDHDMHDHLDDTHDHAHETQGHDHENHNHAADHLEDNHDHMHDDKVHDEQNHDEDSHAHETNAEGTNPIRKKLGDKDNHDHANDPDHDHDSENEHEHVNSEDELNISDILASGEEFPNVVQEGDNVEVLPPLHTDDQVFDDTAKQPKSIQ